MTLGKPAGEIRLAHSIESVSEMTTLSPQLIRKEIRDGRLRAKRYGRRIAILDDDLQEWLASGEDWAAANESHPAPA